MPIWTESFRIRAYEVDPSGVVSLPSLCNYFQEAAGNHATALGFANDQLLREQNLTWVLARLQIEMQRYPAWRETVHFETWPSAIDRLYAYRDFVLRDDAGAQLGAGISGWMLINPVTRRPARMPGSIIDFHLPDRTRALPGNFSKLPNLTAPAFETPFAVQRSDLDMNAHVNNVRFIEWLLEAVPEPVWRRQHLSALEMTFRAEAILGDTVAAQVEQAVKQDEDAAQGSAFLHRLVHGHDGRILATARSTWQPR